jgi:ectoine hydroxylase-related dioxygenase (phytanoyl-CoA dioxygenase family)
MPRRSGRRAHPLPPENSELPGFPQRVIKNGTPLAFAGLGSTEQRLSSKGKAPAPERDRSWQPVVGEDGSLTATGSAALLGFAMSFEAARHIAAIERDGYTVIEDFLLPPVLAEVRRVLALYLDSNSGRNDFEGLRTERVYTLVARARVFWDIVVDARVMQLCEHFLLPNFLLTASQAIRILPGETPQPIHSDDAFHLLPRPRPMISLSTIVAVDAFTADNGATSIIPGSHLWDDEKVSGQYAFRPATADESQANLEALAIPAVMPAGACVVFAGTLLHGGGRNTSDAPRCAFSNQYCQPWARPQENFFLGVPLEVARQMPPRLQSLLGYSIHPPFIGQVTASHPVKALAPDFTNRVVAQAAAAGAKLPE